MVRILLLALLALTLPREVAGRTWTIVLEGSIGQTPFHIPLEVELTDPVGSATVVVSGVPVTFTHTADTFSLSAYITLSTGCLATVFFSGSTAIQSVVGNSVVSGSLSGAMVESCSSGGGVVIAGYDRYFIKLGRGYYVYEAPRYTFQGGESASATSAVSGTFTGSSIGLVPAAQVQTASRNVTLRTPLGNSSLSGDSDVSAGGLIQTGSDGGATIAFRDATQLIVSPNSQVVLPLLPDPSSVPDLVTVIRGKAQIVTGSPPGPGTPRNGIKTATAIARPVGTDFSAEYSQPVTTGTTTIEVQQGRVEVTNRQGAVYTVLAGQRASFEDAVPRVILVLPPEGGAVLPGQTNIFLWTRYPGAADYLLEYTLNAAGFARPNATAVEQPANTLFLRAGLFTQAEGLVQLALPLATGLVQPGTRVFWRVFPVDGSRRILSGATASDAATLFVQ